jgi:hypothetical protein
MLSRLVGCDMISAALLSEVVPRKRQLRPRESLLDHIGNHMPNAGMSWRCFRGAPPAL